jgi:hypothetical protein
MTQAEYTALRAAVDHLQVAIQIVEVSTTAHSPWIDAVKVVHQHARTVLDKAKVGIEP